MIADTLTLDLRDRVLTITLNRPGRFNAFTVRMARELIDSIERASRDDGVGAIVVTGAGGAFCAGMDLAAGGNVFGFDDGREVTLEELERKLDAPEMIDGVRDIGGQVALAIFDCDKPVIGAINGVAVGVGATLPLAMDIRLASTEARFGFVFGKVGIVPDACSTWFLPRIVGVAKALEWTYSGELVEAPEALRRGLVGEVLPPQELLPRACALARRMAGERSAVSTALTRHMFWRHSAAPHPLHAHLVESLALLHTSATDGREGVAAFLAKRAPCFDQGLAGLPPFLSRWKTMTARGFPASSRDQETQENDR